MTASTRNLLGGLATLIWLGCVSAHAQTTPISINQCDGTGSQNVDTSTNCSVAPYGAMTLNLQIATDAKGIYTLTFTFTNASGSFTAVDANQTSLASQTSAQATGTATITTGTGIFIGVAGSLNYTLMGAGSYTAQAFSLTATGQITTTATTTCQATGLQLSLDNLIETATLQGLEEENDIFTPVTVTLGNCSASSLNYTVQVPSVSQNNGIALTVIPLSGAIPSGSTSTITVTISVPNPQPGNYLGSFTITSSGASATSVTQTLNVNVNISGGPLLVLSAGGGIVSPGSTGPLMVSTQGLTGSIPFTASATTLSGGDWLQVSPNIGAASSSSPANLTITVPNLGLANGNYFGRIDVAATGVANSPQSVEIVLIVTGNGETPYTPIQATPTGLVFYSNGSAPTPQTVEVSNPNTQAVTPSVITAFSDNSNWLTPTLSPAMIPAYGSAKLTLAVNAAGLSGGLRTAVVHLGAGGGGVWIRVGFVLVSGGPATAIAPAEPRTSASCSPAQLFTAFTQNEGGFQSVAGIPVPVAAIVVDDCGNPLNSGSVIANFSTGDAPVALNSFGGGNWSGTWLPHNPAGGDAAISLSATSASGKLSGSTSVSGALTANSTTPVLSAAAPVVNGASFALNTPITPGSFVSIFGNNLAASPALENSLPYPSMLGRTQVLLGGVPMPLEYVGNGQINAVVPWEVPVNTTMQLIVEQNGMSSMPEPVNIAPAEPAVFTSNSTGSGQGAIIVLKSNGKYFLPGQGSASAGDVLEIYATGLGAVSATVADGTASPSAPPAQTVAPVTCTIGGQDAIVGFAGLAPGFAGLYQVNVTVPSGIAAGAQVPVVLTQGIVSSPPVTVAIGQ